MPVKETNSFSAQAERWTAKAQKKSLFTPGGSAKDFLKTPAVESLMYSSSVRETPDAIYALLKAQDRPRKGGLSLLGILARQERGFQGFSGWKKTLASGLRLLIGPLSHENAQAMRRALPFTAPSPLAGKAVTVGLGDRLGVAGAGHIRTIRGREAYPVLAQQSVRELNLTGRSYEEVLDASTWAVFQEGYEGPWGADGDHLKTEEWVRTALRIGFTMITADVSDYIRAQHLLKPEAELAGDYTRLDESYRRRIEAEYLPLRIELDTGEAVAFTREALMRTALTYREAIEHALRLYQAGAAEKGEGAFDFELSVDETATPTTPQAHAFIAGETLKLGMRVTSLAPRFVGEFQKGIDYIGDPKAFESTFRTHAALARHFGYKVSVHSGSDKFTVFPAVGRLTGGRFHIKTAGTNWLEAMKVIARTQPGLYRRLHAKALASFAKATQYYHVTTNLGNVPALAGLKDAQLPALFANPDARQLVHITYGEILSDPGLKAEFFAALQDHIEEYWRALQEHIGRHLDLLGIKGGANE